MSVQHTVNYLGWLQEAAYGTDPNPNSNTHYVIGKNVTGQQPSAEVQVNINHYATYEPGQILTTNHQVKASPVGFEPVNCLPLKYIFQEAQDQANPATGISEAAGVFTIDPTTMVPLAQRASWTWRTESSNSGESVRDHYLGNRAIDLTESLNFVGGAAQRLQSVLNYLGLRRVTPATDVSNPPIYPNSTSQSYKKDVNTILTWDGDNMKPEMINFSWTVANEPQTHPVDAQKYPEEQTTGNATYGWTVNIRRAGGNSAKFQIDWRDQLDNQASYNDLRFKIFNTATLYKDYTFGTCTITSIKRNIVKQASVAIPTYEIRAVPTTMAIEFKDGLNKTTFYNL
ncbi:hypothetical protein LCGC14_2373990 [marine sediment metagenome]|uniref:Uncharacterized protein n=1 Tax=marine sediment metagenome TaxID=412755 RepID=A0A0F9EXI3_9ZZZZ